MRSLDGSGEPPFEFALFSTDGVKVESVISESAGEARSAPWNGAIATLYRAARRQALHADRLVADLLADLPASESTAGGPLIPDGPPFTLMHLTLSALSIKSARGRQSTE